MVTSSAATKTGSGNSIHNLTETKLLPNQGSYNNAIVDAESNKKNNKNLIFRAINEFKNGWNLPTLPDHIVILEKNIYVKFFKLIGAACLFLIVSGIAQQFNNLTFKCIFIISFVFTIYRLVIIFYNLKQYIVNIYKGKFIVRNSPVNSFNTILKFLGNTAKSTVNFGVGTGVAYCLCYELDEILAQEGKEPYFVPGIRNTIRKIGAEEQAKIFMDRIGIKDKINTNKKKSVTEFLESMTDEEKVKWESETGHPWETIYNEHTKLQDKLFNKTANNTSSITKTISDYIEKEDPFKKNK